MESANKEVFTAILSTRSLQEISASWDWYEQRSTGLGDRFVNSVKEKIQQIERGPYHYGAKYKEYREAGLESFPYQIVYRINKRKKLIRIVSVFHSSRNPTRKHKGL